MNASMLMPHLLTWCNLFHQLASSLWISSFDKSDGTTCSKSDERINVDASWENQAWFSSNLVKVGDVASCVRTACPPKLSLQVWNKLLTICDNVVDIRFVARLFQQVRYSHDITILLQPCVVNLVTFLLYHDCIRLVRTTL
jgi:hypothetical protein